jgi:hypothetical protein
MDIQTNSWIFQNDATAVGDGKVFKTGRNDQLTVYITGSATFEVLFEGCDGETIPNWFPVPARKFPEMTVVTSTTVTGAYSIDLANFAGIRCRISAIANGALRVTGRAVNVGSGSLTNIPNTINTIPVDSDGDEKFTSTNPAIVKATDLETLVTTLNGKVDTLDTVIDNILAKIITAPSTEAKQDTAITALGTLLTQTGYEAKADIALTALRDALIGVDDKTLSDLATALGLLATSAKQDSLEGKIDTLDAVIDSILAKIISAPATEAKQDTLIAKDFATQTTLAAILAKIIAAPATEAKQTALNALIGEVQAAPTANTMLARLKALEDKLISGISLSGSKAEQASAQDTQVATTAKTYTKAAGATQMEVYCETGYIRVRTDGEACTSTTGEPIAAGFGSGWQVDSISVYYIQESVITVVSR